MTLPFPGQTSEIFQTSQKWSKMSSSEAHTPQKRSFADLPMRAARLGSTQGVGGRRQFLNRLETSSQTLTLPPFLHCQLPPCSCPPGAGFRSAQLRSKLESKDPVARLKHHGSEGRIGPAARSPDCQTSLSEPTRN